MKTKCRLFGHKWVFPAANHVIPTKYRKENIPLINVEVLKKPKCKRCGIEEIMPCFIGEKGSVVAYWV